MLEGFALDVLMAVGNASNGGNGGNMLAPLANQCKGQTAVIYGNAPSLTGPVAIDNSFSIALNNALALVPDTDIWLCAESEIHRRSEWFWQYPDYKGLAMWDAAMFHNGLWGDLQARGVYSPEFLDRVTYFLRQGLDGATTGPKEAFRVFRDGLFQYLPLAEVDGLETASFYQFGELYGSGLLCAIHLAAGMGADVAHLYGCSLSWKPGEAQHADGIDTFGRDAGDVNDVITMPDGRLSTRYFKHSAKAILWYCERAGLEIVDHSDSLLSHPEML